MPTSADRSEIIHPMLPDQIQKTSAPVLSGRIFQGLLGLVGLIDDKTDILLSDILWKAGNIYRTAKEIVFFPISGGISQLTYTSFTLQLEGFSLVMHPKFMLTTV